MSKSLISDDKQCWICGNREVEKHHIYGGPNRNLSEKYGCFVYLCHNHHTGTNQSVHFNNGINLMLKKHTQRQWEMKYGDREEFRKVFGRSYL